MRKEHYLIFMTFILILGVTTAYPKNECSTPHNENGFCMDIKHCKKLRELLENQRHVPSVVAFLKKSFCGHETGITKVCCPLENASSGESKPIKESTGNIKTRSPSKLPSQETCGHSNPISNRIFGGVQSILGTWPWMVAMGYQEVNGRSHELYWLCGGTLITNTHVLTAAQCVNNRKTVRLAVARLGDLNLDSNVNDGATPLDVPIDDIIIHEKYNPRENTNDIAILKLKNSVSYDDFIQPICLPNQLDNMKHVDMTKPVPFVVGWGSTQELFFSSEQRNTAMMEVQIPLTDISKCKEAYSSGYNVIDDRVLCAGYQEGGKDSCGGDAGGPLMWPKGDQYYLMGIVSYGFISCGEPNQPGVYTKVTSFVDWIVEKINNN